MSSAAVAAVAAGAAAAEPPGAAVVGAAAVAFPDMTTATSVDEAQSLLGIDVQFVNEERERLSI